MITIIFCISFTFNALNLSPVEHVTPSDSTKATVQVSPSKKKAIKPLTTPVTVTPPQKKSPTKP